MKLFFSFMSVLASTILAGNAFSDTMGSVVPKASTHWVTSFGLGSAWEHAGETQTFFLAPEILKTYSANKATNALVMGEFFVGAQRDLFWHWQGQLGFAVAVLQRAMLEGEIWDDADPLFNNLSYQYRVQNTQVAVKGKLLLDPGYWLIPWVSGSAGVALNRAYAFTNTPLIFEAVANNNFSNKSRNVFTYTLAAGIQKQLNQYWQVGAGYEYIDWGKNELGSAAGQTLSSGLKLRHFYTTGVLFNITYLT